MLGGATGATQPLGRGEAGPSSLASSEQTLTEACRCLCGAPSEPLVHPPRRPHGAVTVTPEAAPCPASSSAVGLLVWARVTGPGFCSVCG